jgi:hypothetical protein
MPARGGAQRQVEIKTTSAGPFELRIAERVTLDVLVTGDDEIMTFVRVDGELVAEIPVAGQA